MTDSHTPPKTMGQQFGRRSWAEPWKIKMVEPINMISREERKRRWTRPVTTPSSSAPKMSTLTCSPTAAPAP
jgi:hypothetical protein